MPKALKTPGGVAAKVEALVRPVVQGVGLTLWDVRFEKDGNDWFLRVLVDNPNGPMDTNLCEAASRAMDPVLDEADPIPQSYYLEVGSPGLGRKLTREAHFDAMRGQKVLAKLYAADAAGRKEIAGNLVCLAGDVVTLDTDYGKVDVPVKNASYFKLCDDENLF